MRVFTKLLLSSCCFLIAANSTFAQEKTPQIVLISFDGAHNNALWDKSRQIAKRVDAKFTYFLSCAFLITKDDARGFYRSPKNSLGLSNVGFAQTKSEINTRLDHIWQARAEGHEMANHGCGHFDGKAWSINEWNAEFDQFRDILSSAWMRNGFGDQEPQDWQNFAINEIKGFRAPYLSHSKNLFASLEANNFTYDASTVSNGPKLPKLDTVTKFALPLIPEGPSSKKIIAMDYNLYVRHSKAKDNPERSQVFEERSYQAFKTAFDKEYNGARVPLQMGFHFVEMNAGAYWRALERFAQETCSLPDVDCLTYQQALERLGSKRSNNS